MNQFTPHIYTFILPLFFGNIIHMFIVKGNYFPALARPLSVRWFGASKTYRAFLIMPLVCGCSSLFFRSIALYAADLFWSFSIGFILGFTYLVAELPNSFIKRRLGILPGQVNPRYKALQYIIDKTDSMTLMCIVYFFIEPISLLMLLLLFAVSLAIHVAFSLLLFQFRIKKSF